MNNLKIREGHEIQILIKIALSILLIIGVFKLPYGYYTFLRVGVTGAAIFISYKGFHDQKVSWPIIFAMIALLFNPIFPIYLKKNIWIYIDSLAALIILISLFFVDLKLKSY